MDVAAEAGAVIDFPPVAVEAVPDGAHVVWEPNLGPQKRALASVTDELFYGGAKGGGKTDFLISKPLRHAHKSLYAAAFVRESYKELLRAIDRARIIYSRLPAAKRPAWNGSLQRFTWPSGAFVQFGYARTLDDLTWTQGGSWAEVLYDELGNQPNERVIDTLISEIRCPDPTVRRQFCGTGNPGFAGHPVMKRRYVQPCGKAGDKIAWFRAKLPNGVYVPTNRQFVPARITDNPTYANDHKYMAALMLLPERMRRCLLEGDWDASTGVAFDELEPRIHLRKPFQCPDHWPFISAFDWGFDHFAVFMWGRVSDDGRVYICDTIKRRLLRDWDLASTYNALVPTEALRNVQAGHDCWHIIKARGENAPQTAEYFLKSGIHLVKANIDRVQGYRNMLQYFAWQPSEFLPQREPMVRFFDTPGNRWLIEEHLPAQVMDPDDPSDILKQDVDSETGAGGDDGTDCLRYLLASRPLKAESLAHLIKVSAWDPDVLRREAEKFRRPDTTPAVSRRDGVFLGA